MRAFIKYKNAPQETQKYVYSNAYTISSDESPESSGEITQEAMEETEAELVNEEQNELIKDVTDEEPVEEVHEETAGCEDTLKNDDNVSNGEKEAE